MSWLSDITNSISPGVGSLLGAGLGFLGQQDTNANQASIAQQTNQMSAEEAQRNRDFQERMSNSAYQRQVADMESAGLNPMLAYIKGGGASSPSGSQASFTSAQYQSPIKGALESRLTSAQSAKTEAEVPKIKAETDLTQAQIGQVESTIKKIDKETRNLDDEQTRLRAVYINLAESSALMAQQGETEVARRKVMKATADKLVVEKKLSQAEYDAMERTNFIGVTAREVKVLSDVGSEWVDKFLPWKQGKSTTNESTEIIRDKEGREVGRNRNRSTR